MNTEQLKKHIDNRLYYVNQKIIRVEQKVDAILRLVTEHLGDPHTIADLQRRLNDSQRALRDLEYTNFLEKLEKQKL